MKDPKVEAAMMTMMVATIRRAIRRPSQIPAPT
jgi:hypothetical protein